MGRTAKYTDEDILDAALALIADDGPQSASVVAIAKRLGAPSGSIYHRFTSRDLILATLWVRTVKRFQRGFLEALGHDDPERAARGAVRHTLDWTATNRGEATILTMYRRDDLIALWPEQLGEELATLNDEVKRAVVCFTCRRFGTADSETLGAAGFALIEIPYAAARQALRDGRPPRRLLHVVTAAALAALDARSTGA
ncbi:TetR/AcrR family transcriptional regulator [Gulosibacter sp. 10]|uniref:TetR/AcrR family transcriptional regulator n=1 Tax=Gulosibacter sp. 10 TaxID=1255570 RepID=UPI00097F121F|nr:TetR/AcrR family transcriptional regulator [Gulosibacter sp. 10]SJM64523.1 Transcriptional regulator, TetR family [Gulosibacter sp. 10]